MQKSEERNLSAIRTVRKAAPTAQILLPGVASTESEFLRCLRQEYAAINLELSNLDFPFLEYTIGEKSHDRPAPIGPLQIGNAASPRPFRICLTAIGAVESSRQPCPRTSRHAPRRVSGSTLGSSPEATGAAVR